MTNQQTVTAAMLGQLRLVDGFERAQLAGNPEVITGGFWATLLNIPLVDAPVPEVVLRIMPDAELGEKETIFQTQAGHQGFHVPQIFVAGTGDPGLGQSFVVMAKAPGSPPLAGLDGLTALIKLPSLARRLPALLGNVMAELHQLDPQPFLDALQFQSAATDTAGVLRRLAGLAEAQEREDLLRSAEWLADHRPAAAAPVVCHGDLHPFNVLVGDDQWTLLDWTAAVVAEPAYDLSFTALLLGHPPLVAPRPLRPAIGAAGRYVANRFQAAYQVAGRGLPEQDRLDWHMALHSLRILLEVDGWRDQGTVNQHVGHPWFTIGPVAADTLLRMTGVRVSW